MTQHLSVSETDAIPTRISVTLWNDLVAVMNILEHQRMRSIWVRPGDKTILEFCTYIHSIVRWKESLLYLAPELREVVGFCEMAEMSFLDRVFRIFEDAQSLDKRDLIRILILIFDEVQRPGSTQRLDAALADQLQLAINSRLQVFCTSVFDFRPPKEPRKKLENLCLAQMIDYNKETSCCIPPHSLLMLMAYG
jgi:translation initiation factor IF-1